MEDPKELGWLDLSFNNLQEIDTVLWCELSGAGKTRTQRQHCWRAYVSQMCPRAQHLCPGHIKCFWKSSDTFVVAAFCNMAGHNVAATICPRFARALPFHSQEWSISNFSCSPTRNMTSHSKENLAFHSLLRWNIIIVPCNSLINSPIHFSLYKRLGECTLWTWEWKGCVSRMMSQRLCDARQCDVNPPFVISQVLLEYPKIKILYLHGNDIVNLAEIDKLAGLPNLTTLTLHGNPIEEREEYKRYVLAVLPGLKSLDFCTVTKQDRATAQTWKERFGTKFRRKAGKCWKIQRQEISFEQVLLTHFSWV